MYKLGFLRFFRNYVAIEFPLFFEEISSNCWDFADLSRFYKADILFPAWIFVNFSQKFITVCFFLPGA